MARKGNPGRWFAGAFVLILALITCLVLKPPASPPRPPAGAPDVPVRVRQDLCILSLSVAAYLRDGDNLAPDQRQDNGAVTRALRGGNAAKTEYLWIQPGRLLEECYVDLWQRPYVIWTFSSDEKARSMGLPDGTRVWIYSLGPNGVDEQGRGDDISLPPVGEP
jgi:hypothetical protein